MEMEMEMEMERWGPLMNILLSSPLPESEASHWLNQSFSSNSNSNSITAISLISLLSKPTQSIVLDSSSRSKRIMWMQTLPNAVQSRILSFLTVDYRKFCSGDLTELAKNILREGEGVDFWVKKSAHQLLDKVSQSNYEWVSGLNLDSEEESLENEFDSLPNWLKDEANANCPLLPWLPLTKEELNFKMPINLAGDDGTPMVDVDEVEKESGSYDSMEIDTIDGALDPEIEEKVALLRTRILNFESTAETVGLANDIRQLCLESGGGDSLKILSLLEPWKADDETASILITNLSDKNDQELGWPSHVLSSIILPKFLVLETPISRVLVAAIVEYCKVHQRDTSNALLHPLVLRKNGVNKAICEVLTKIIKECLHPAQVSAFCQKVLCCEGGKKRFMCLPCHQCLVSQELVWNEPLFTLFQNILNHNVHLTRDTIDQLVYRILESVEVFSKSLKFGNFLLCLVNKCSSLLKSHKLPMIEAVEHTDTLVTKSILSKLATL